MIINRIDINPNLVIPEACRGSCMVQKTLESAKKCVNMGIIGPKNSDKMGTNIPPNQKNIESHWCKVKDIMRKEADLCQPLPPTWME